MDKKGNKSDIVKRLIGTSQNKIDEFIQNKYQKLITERQSIISDEDLKKELMKVKDFRWGVVQG